MNNLAYDEVAHLPHIIAFPCTCANFLHTRMELHLNRPRAFFWHRGPFDQTRRVTFLDAQRDDYAWVQGTEALLHDNHPRAKVMYLYDDPVNAIFGWLTFGGQRVDAGRIEAACALLKKTMQKFMLSPHVEKLDMRKWMFDPDGHVDRVAEFIGADTPTPTSPPGGAMRITWPALVESSRVQSAPVCHLAGGRGHPTSGGEAERFREEFGPTVDRLVLTDDLRDALQK